MTIRAHAHYVGIVDRLKDAIVRCARPADSRMGVDDDVVPAAAALDGFTGPSNWVGWLAYGMDHVHLSDRRAASADQAER